VVRDHRGILSFFLKGALLGVTIGLYGDTGAGKTTLAGEYAKFIRKTRKKNSILYTADRGGYESIRPLVRAGVLTPRELGPGDDPWIWVDECANGVGIDDNCGLAIYDSGTSFSEALLTAAHKSDFQIGQQRTQKFTVARGTKQLNVSINNEAHYGVVQGFLLDAIWKSTWLTRRDVDVLWTFSVHRGEEQDRTPILGPKLAGKALTAAIPKWFQYFFRVTSIPMDGSSPRHILHLTEASELAGMGHSFGNARYPLDASTPLPPSIEPASLVEAIALIEKGQAEADLKLKQELGL
jgi:hypothetical protein